MNDLIEITKTYIGSENVNSVNARDIYDFLEVKTHFSTWIKRAIEKYDFIDGVDFQLFKNGKSNSNNPTMEYVVTLDMAKELSMLENNSKGKETRKYFIAAEKASLKVLTISEQIALIATGHQETDKRLNVLEDKVENDIPLTSAQKHNIKKKVNALVYQLKKNHNLHDDFIPKCYSRVWKKVKDHFVVSSYMEIPRSKFDELVRVVDAITISDVV